MQPALAKSQPLSSPLGHAERVVVVMDTSVALSCTFPGERKGAWSAVLQPGTQMYLGRSVGGPGDFEMFEIQCKTK